MNSSHNHSSPDVDFDPKEFWEERYGGEDQVWSGNVNKVLAELVADFTPGKSLDLGCGEGADVVWLAANGWDATGIDISSIAISRAQAASKDAGATHTRFICSDLSELDQTDTFDLVTATFFHSPVELDRARILKRVATLVNPGGHLLIISHAAPPPWAELPDTVRHFMRPPEEDLAELNLDPDDWQTVMLETRLRGATDPQGEPAELEDGIILLQRK